MKNLIIATALIAASSVFNVEVVENGNGYYLEDGNRAVIVETVCNPVEPLLTLVID